MKKSQFKIKKNQRPTCRQAGMTYVELIVVLSIFSVLSAIVLFNYGTFQSKVDIKSLASDIAIKIVEAQKASLSGKLPPAGYTPTTVPASAWKPAYGVYFNSLTTVDGGDGIYLNKKFIYFTDLNNSGLLDGSTSCGGECLEKTTITKGNYISGIVEVIGGVPSSIDNLTATFSRINSGVIMSSSSVALPSNVSYVQINIASPAGATAIITLYPSGRVQVN